jgi:hypothetical protein
VITGHQVFCVRQISKIGDELIGGRFWRSLSIEQGQYAAAVRTQYRQLKAACGGDLSKVRRIVKLGGFVHTKRNRRGDPANHQWLFRPMVGAFR